MPTRAATRGHPAAGTSPARDLACCAAAALPARAPHGLPSAEGLWQEHARQHDAVARLERPRHLAAQVQAERAWRRAFRHLIGRLLQSARHGQGQCHAEERKCLHALARCAPDATLALARACQVHKAAAASPRPCASGLRCPRPPHLQARLLELDKLAALGLHHGRSHPLAAVGLALRLDGHKGPGGQGQAGEGGAVGAVWCGHAGCMPTVMWPTACAMGCCKCLCLVDNGSQARPQSQLPRGARAPAQDLLVQLCATLLVCVGDHAGQRLDVCDVRDDALEGGAVQ